MTSKLTASPEVVQTCKDLLDSDLTYYFMHGFGIGMLLTLALTTFTVMPFLVDAVDIYAPKPYRDFLRSRREMRLDRKIKRLEKLQKSSEVQS